MARKKKGKSDAKNTAQTKEVAASVALQQPNISERPCVSRQTGPLLIQLPAEIRVMIWSYVIASCRLAIGMDGSYRFAHTIMCRVESRHDPEGSYPPHPLCYVSKSISTEVSTQVYRDATFTIRPDFCRRQLRLPIPVRNLSMSVRDVHQWLRFVVPFFDTKVAKPKRELIVHNMPHLEWLQVRQTVDCSGTVVQPPRVPRKVNPFPRLLFYQKSFVAEIQISCSDPRHGKVTSVGHQDGTFELFGFPEDASQQNPCTRMVVQVVNSAYRFLRQGRGEENVCCRKHARIPIRLTDYNRANMLNRGRTCPDATG